MREDVIGASFLHLINLPFHEAGHILFSPFGEFMTTLGGSLLQVLVPLICAGAFLTTQWNPFAAAVMGWWAGENLMDVAIYINDARALQLTLIGGQTGAEVEGHDWEHILLMTNSLHLDHRHREHHAVPRCGPDDRLPRVGRGDRVANEGRVMAQRKALIVLAAVAALAR